MCPFHTPSTRTEGTNPAGRTEPSGQELARLGHQPWLLQGRLDGQVDAKEELKMSSTCFTSMSKSTAF
jgi:hypothetical protein